MAVTAMQRVAMPRVSLHSYSVYTFLAWIFENKRPTRRSSCKNIPRDVGRTPKIDDTEDYPRKRARMKRKKENKRRRTESLTRGCGRCSSRTIKALRICTAKISNRDNFEHREATSFRKYNIGAHNIFIYRPRRGEEKVGDALQNIQITKLFSRGVSLFLRGMLFAPLVYRTYCEW